MLNFISRTQPVSLQPLPHAPNSMVTREVFARLGLGPLSTRCGGNGNNHPDKHAPSSSFRPTDRVQCKLVFTLRSG